MGVWRMGGFGHRREEVGGMPIRRTSGETASMSARCACSFRGSNWTTCREAPRSACRLALSPARSSSFAALLSQLFFRSYALPLPRRIGLCLLSPRQTPLRMILPTLRLLRRTRPRMRTRRIPPRRSRPGQKSKHPPGQQPIHWRQTSAGCRATPPGSWPRSG